MSLSQISAFLSYVQNLWLQNNFAQQLLDLSFKIDSVIICTCGFGGKKKIQD